MLKKNVHTVGMWYIYLYFRSLCAKFSKRPVSEMKNEAKYKFRLKQA